MDRITFVNEDEPALDEDNLNQLQTNIETAIQGTKIYDGGNNGNANSSITLTDSSSNYDYLDIEYRCNRVTRNFRSVKRVPVISTPFFSLIEVTHDTDTSNTNIVGSLAFYQISASTITRIGSNNFEIGDAGLSKNTGNSFYITKVWGVKYGTE